MCGSGRRKIHFKSVIVNSGWLYHQIMQMEIQYKAERCQIEKDHVYTHTQRHSAAGYFSENITV